MTHPEEKLAQYVDGTLGDRERGDVDAHLAECETCREEVALAGRARTSLAALPELDVPFGTIRPGLERKARTAPDRFRRTAWATGMAAAAAIAAIVTLVLVHNPAQNGGDQAGTFASGTPAPESILKPGVEYDTSSIHSVAVQYAERLSKTPSAPTQDAAAETEAVGGSGSGAGTTAGGGVSAPTAATTKDSGNDASSSASLAGAQTLKPRACFRRGAGLAPHVKLLAFVKARFQGQPVYIGAYVQDGGPPDSVVVSVVSRSDCAPVTVVEQRLP